MCPFFLFELACFTLKLCCSFTGKTVCSLKVSLLPSFAICRCGVFLLLFVSCAFSQRWSLSLVGCWIEPACCGHCQVLWWTRCGEACQGSEDLPVLARHFGDWWVIRHNLGVSRMTGYFLMSPLFMTESAIFLMQNHVLLFVLYSLQWLTHFLSVWSVQFSQLCNCNVA